MRTLRLLPVLLAVVASLALAGGSTVPQAHATGTPVSNFGMSLFDGGTPGPSGPDGCSSGCNAKTMDDMNAVVQTMDVGTDDAFVRAAYHWDPTNVDPSSWSATDTHWNKYDAFTRQAFLLGLDIMPEIHTSHSGYIRPNDTACVGSGCGFTKFQAAVRAFADRYGPGGDWPAGSGTYDKPTGFPGITRYEVWNEPNTSTGHADASVDMTAANIDLILQYASAGLVQGANDNSWLSDLQIAGPALGAGDSGHAGPAESTRTDGYIYKMWAADNDVWSYLSPSGAKPGVLTVHIYGGSQNPFTCTQASFQGHCIYNILNARDELDAETTGAVSGAAIHLGITEGGYSGDSDLTGTGTCSNGRGDTWDETTATNYLEEWFNVLRANPDANIDFAAPFNPTDQNTLSCASSNAYAYWEEGLGMMDDASGTLTFKDQGQMVHDHILNDWDPIAVNHDPTTPGTPTGTTPTDVAPSISWTASTDSDGDPITYHVFRDSVEIDTTTNLSYTDSSVSGAGTYVYSLKASDPNGGLSAMSGTKSIAYDPNHAPNAPTGLGGTTPTTSAPVLSWTAATDPDSGDSISQYHIFRDGSEVGTSATTSFTDSAATFGTYSYTVKAEDSHSALSVASSAYSIEYDDPSPSNLAEDAFTRSVTPGWGTADTGGSYTQNGTAGTWTNGSVGILQATATNQDKIASLNVSNLSSEGFFTFKTSKVPVGGAYYVREYARMSGSGVDDDGYRVVVTINTDGSVDLNIRKHTPGTGSWAQVGTVATPIASGFAANHVYDVRFQVSGASPTALQAKLWDSTGSEPGTWAVSTSDGSTALQTTGSWLGLEEASGTNVTNAPYTVQFDDWSVAPL